jgi:5-methylcytosine-specific restriction endonuclease McrA
MTEYSFVIDSTGKQLSPTPINKAWFLIRKKRAILISKFPMVIQLNKEVSEKDNSEFIVGIDDGSKYVGIAIAQKYKTKNKFVFKGTIEHRQDVKKLMDVRQGYRRYHRQQKRYRKARFNNRGSSNRKNRLAPSIKQKKDVILRIIIRLSKWCIFNKIILEDVQIDIRALQEGHKLYKWQYQKSIRLDENLRKAIILRDKCKCLECGKLNCRLEVHHIVPRRSHGSDALSNLITLCEKCHDKIKGIEKKFIDKYQKFINGNNIRFDYAQHVMQGKNYLRQQLSKISSLTLTYGSETANKRIDWDIKKTHSNDAIVITGLKPDNYDIKDWVIKPMRRQNKAKTDNVLGIKHRDLVSYTYKNGETHVGYVTALYPELKALNFQSKTKHCKKVNAKKCDLLWKYNKIYWLNV